jgi:nucleoside-diphosphate-sugar epimerase
MQEGFVPFDPCVVPSSLTLIAGSGGFMDAPVVQALLADGYRNLGCLVTPSSGLRSLISIAVQDRGACIDIVEGNLPSTDLCREAVQGVWVIYGLAAGIDADSLIAVFASPDQ